MRKSILAAILSLIEAGLGQICNGQVLKGVVFLVAQFINAALATVFIGWILMPVVDLWTPVGKYKTGRT